MQIIILVLKSLHRRIGMQLFGQHIIIINLLVIKVLLPVYVVDVIIVCHFMLRTETFICECDSNKTQK